MIGIGIRKAKGIPDFQFVLITSILYTIIISPLELLFEVIFSIANRLIGNAGVSIVFLSLAVNFLVLPLYKRADELQAEERDIQTKMAARLKQIKAMNVFSWSRSITESTTISLFML